MALPIGMVVAGRYKILRLLGEGGFGAVYLAEDTHLGTKRVAVKESFDNSLEAQEQFRLEAQLLANLEHNGLPRVTDHFLEPDGRQFLVMDYVEGNDLDECLMGAGHPFADRQAAELLLQVCEAVAYLHTRRPQPIIHRDIKPPNIKISRNGQAVLVDFGIAKLYHPSKHTAKIAKAFTPHFSPPEQYIGKTDTRSDVYALGATLYCLVCGAPPVDAMDRLTQGIEITPPYVRNPAVSRDLAQIILQALDLDPERRFQNANRMAAALKGFLGGQPASGGSAWITCPSCGWQNRAGARFCARDRTPLSLAGGPALPQQASMPSVEAIAPEMLFEIANMYARKNDFPQAILRYEACLQQGASSAALLHNLGVSYLNVAQPAKAVNILEKGAVRYPGDGDIQFQLARAYMQLNQDERALSCAARACQVAPDDAANQFLYGLLLLDAKRCSEAIHQFEKAIHLEPDSVAAHLYLGRAFGQSNDLKRAISELRRAAQLDPASAEPLIWMGIFYGQAKKNREALEAFQSALRVEPDSSLANYLIGNLWLERDEYNKALPFYNKAVALNPRDPDNHTHLALCYALLGRRSEAIAAIQQALRIDPNYRPARELLAKL